MSFVGSVCKLQQMICLYCIVHILTELSHNVLPGSVRPRATMLSNPLGGSVSDQLSIVMECSLPNAASAKNMIPVLPAVRTVHSS